MTDNTLPTEFDYKYHVEMFAGEWRHTWVIVGLHGAVHFHTYNPKSRHSTEYGPSAGLEIHYRTAPPHMRGAPTQEHCWVLRAPCWHDGTSLYATETLYPLINWHDPLEFFRVLVREMGRFEEAPNDD